MPAPSNAIIVAGHSHTAALIGPNTHPDGDICLLPVAGFERVFGLHGPRVAGHPVRTEAYWSALTQHGSGNIIALLFGGNEHYTYFLFEQPPRFDFVPRNLASMPVESDSAILPEALIRAKFERLLGHNLRSLLQMLEVGGDRRIVLVGTPPPRAEYRAYQSFRDMLAPHNPDAMLMPATKMLKLWHVLQELYREHAEEQDIEFLPVPEEARADGGFLRPEFSDEYETHANAAYGQLMLQYLAHRLS